MFPKLIHKTLVLLLPPGLWPLGLRTGLQSLRCSFAGLIRAFHMRTWRWSSRRIFPLNSLGVNFFHPAQQFSCRLHVLLWKNGFADQRTDVVRLHKILARHQVQVCLTFFILFSASFSPLIGCTALQFILHIHLECSMRAGTPSTDYSYNGL